jgi:phosphatidylinositol glycan class W
VTVLSALVPFSYSIWIVILLMAVYQIALKHYGLQTYVEEAPRRCDDEEQGILCDFFAANREGILGCIGYLSLYLASEKVGNVCLWKNENYHGWHLSVAAALFWGIHYQLTEIRQIPVSRRTTNASFCAWTMAHNITMLTLIHTIVASTSRKSATSPPPILHAINRHGLLVFVVANLLTGLVNLSMNTLEASDGVALFVLSIYLFGVSGVALLADYILPSKDKRPKQE